MKRFAYSPLTTSPILLAHARSMAFDWRASSGLSFPLSCALAHGRLFANARELRHFYASTPCRWIGLRSHISSR